jgi:hypothetical protein
MDALLATEVQFFCADLGQAFTMPWLKPILQDGDIEENVSEDLRAGNSAEFSKPQFPLPDREFESVPLRQLVSCFSREISVSGIIAE